MKIHDGNYHANNIVRLRGGFCEDVNDASCWVDQRFHDERVACVVVCAAGEIGPCAARTLWKGNAVDGRCVARRAVETTDACGKLPAVERVRGPLAVQQANSCVSTRGAHHAAGHVRTV